MLSTVQEQALYGGCQQQQQLYSPFNILQKVKLMMSLNKELGVLLPGIAIELKRAGNQCFNYVKKSLGPVPLAIRWESTCTPPYSII